MTLKGREPDYDRKGELEIQIEKLQAREAVLVGAARAALYAIDELQTDSLAGAWAQIVRARGSLDAALAGVAEAEPDRSEL